MKKIFSVCLAVLMIAAVIPAGIVANAAPNYFTTAYAITCEQDLLDFAQHLYNGDINYIESNVVMQADLDMASLGTYTWNTGDFRGVFYGEGYTIRNFSSTTGGLFSSLDQGAVIDNLTMDGALITNSNIQNSIESHIGAFADRCAGVIRNCTLINSSVSGDGYAIGGIAGLLAPLSDQRQIHYSDYHDSTDIFLNNYGVIPDAAVIGCTVEASNISFTGSFLTFMSGSNVIYPAVGGIAGKTDSGIIEQCVCTKGTVEGVRAGGILGLPQAGTLIRACENMSDVYQPVDIMNYSTVKSGDSLKTYLYSLNTYSIETITDAFLQFKIGAGGILACDILKDKETTVLDCMNYGSVRGAFNVGGIAGMVDNPMFMIANCGNDFQKVSRGEVLVLPSAISGYANSGGLVGYLYGTSMYHIPYAADLAGGHETNSVIFNSYNAMPFNVNTGISIGLDTIQGILGGLVGTADGLVTIENCHNAGLPVNEKEEEKPWYADFTFGSLIGSLLTKYVFLTHSFGVVNPNDVYLDKLVGSAVSGIALTDPNYCPDNGAYILDVSNLPWNYMSDPYYGDFPVNYLGGVTTVCGGIIITYSQTIPADNTTWTTSSIGALSATKAVIVELQKYQSIYSRTNIEESGHALKISSAFIPWVCLDQSHGSGIINDCINYAVFENCGLIEGYENGELHDTPSIFDPITSPFGPIDPGEEIQHSLSLTGDICINFYVSVPNADPGAFTKFIFGNNEISVGIDLGDYLISNSNEILYKFRCPLNASQTSMTVTGITYNYYDPAGNNTGYWLESAPFTYSVNEYIDEISNNPSYANNAELMDLMKALSVYSYFSNDVLATDGNFAPSVLFDPSIIDNITASTLQPYAANIADNSSAVSYYGSSLVLRTTTAIRHYFTLDANQAIGDLSFICTDVYGNTTVLDAEQSDNYYLVEISDIASAYLGNTYTVEVRDASDAVISTWEYSGLSYAYRVLSLSESLGNISVEMTNLAKSLLTYYLAAEAYFNV